MATVLENDVRNDFNGDGRSDILWRDESGILFEWLAQDDGSFAWNPAAIYDDIAGPTFLSQVAATGDYNNDGRDDIILWGYENGPWVFDAMIMQWLGQDDGSFAWNPNANYQVSLNTAIVGSGDFNSDGHDDLLIRMAGWNSGDFLYEWLGQADGSFTQSSTVDYQFPSSWTVVGTGDFNHDYHDDILWRDAAGTLFEWLGQPDGSFAWNPVANYNVPNSWTFEDTGDFDGDGHDDVLWRDSAGTFSEWLGQADGSFAWNPVSIYATPTSWNLQGTGDFNKDGRDDILWRDAAGTLFEWLAQADGSFAWNPDANYPTPTSWHIEPSGYFF